LQKQPLGLNHTFCRLRHGVKLHYVYSRPSVELKGKTGLVIFLHGFPDSWYLWHLFLKSSELKNTATLVAVDLPGYGGSDDLDAYDADHVLEIVSEFIIKMRDMYASADDNGQAPVVVVGHDWGAIIGFRLAAEAPVLADRFILSNGLHVSLYATTH
jgi:pimeloyl-ACP methyl ester carboxylesterase